MKILLFRTFKSFLILQYPKTHGFFIHRPLRTPENIRSLRPYRVKRVATFSDFQMSLQYWGVMRRMFITFDYFLLKYYLPGIKMLMNTVSPFWGALSKEEQNERSKGNSFI